MHTITDWLRGLSGPVVYAAVGGMVFAEDALFFSFFIPGETAAVLGGFLAHQGEVSLGWMVLVVVCAAILGDSAGYEIGRHLGPPVLRTRPLRRHAKQVGTVRDLIRRRGPAAVFIGRFIAFVRPLVPSLAGVSRMPYGRFLFYNAMGGIAWGVGFTLLGYFAGAAYTRVEGTVGRVTTIVIAVIVAVALLAWFLRHHRSRGRGPSGDRSDGNSDETSDETSDEPPGERSAPPSGAPSGETSQRPAHEASDAPPDGTSDEPSDDRSGPEH
ncbi:VTT domain-containing protein [Kitasatospora aureofaciens]|uniref:DedA family protein n=1 Tax=Kitasatospora aureofaciens TaxID=1894 RepID=UPI0033EF6432